jgi:hypothetical protein
MQLKPILLKECFLEIDPLTLMEQEKLFLKYVEVTAFTVSLKNNATSRNSA